jgi:signal transduction histidine kinase/ActR/RegA family two-component response regulator
MRFQCYDRGSFLSRRDRVASTIQTVIVAAVPKTGHGCDVLRQKVQQTVKVCLSGPIITIVLFHYDTMTRRERPKRQERIMAEAGPEDKHFMLSYEELEEQIAQLETDVQRYLEERDILFRRNQVWEHRFDALVDLVVVVDDALKVVHANRAAEILLNRPKNQILGKKYYEVLYGQDHPAPDCPLIVAQKTLKAESLELSQSRLGGSFLCSASPIAGRNGKLNGWLLVLRDISSWKRRQRAEQQAVKLDAVSSLSGVIAHEFNNLLTGIQGTLSLVASETKENAPVMERLARMEGYVKRGEELTKQLLGFSEGNRYEVESTDINCLVEKTCEHFKALRKDVRVVTRLQEAIWLTDVDAGQMERVLFHICTNALQAMPLGGELNAETENVVFDTNYSDFFGVPKGEYLKISITDTGEGMDFAVQELIFDPFYTTRPQGTGLGLAFAQRIVRNHGGLINVYSEKGHGTTFNIYLPASGEKTEAESPSENRPRQDTVVTGSETVLLVDDEKFILDVGGEMLKAMGYRVLAANGGSEAMGIYERQGREIDLVILDMIMPDMDGKKTYEKLKAMNDNIKVLLASGYSMTSQVAEILDRGFNGFIQKPFNMIRLSNKIREILARAAVNTGQTQLEITD